MTAENDRTIVIASEFWFGATGAGLAHGFRQLGWDVTEIDLREHRVTGLTKPLRVAARVLHGQCVASYNMAVRQAVAAHRPRAFLTTKGSWLSTETLTEIRRLGASTVNYYPDFHFDYAGLDQDTFPLYDLFFTTKSFQVEHLRSRLGHDRVHLLHHGYSTLVHRPRMAEVKEADYIADVLYVGNHAAYKERWLGALARALPDVKLMIVGGRWSEAGARIAPKATISAGHVLGDGYARIVQRARINLAVHSGPEGPLGWEDLVSTRTFEIPACGGFMLHIDNEEVRGLLEPGRECNVFANEEEMCRKVADYLARPEQRREMIANAMSRCVPAYSYDERARVISDALDAADGSPDREAGRAARVS